MHNSAFRVQELNPFQEWHLHGAADDFEEALKMVGKICNQIGGTVRVLNSADEVVASFEPQDSYPRRFSSTKSIFRTPRFEDASSVPVQRRSGCWNFYGDAYPDVVLAFGNNPACSPI